MQSSLPHWVLGNIFKGSVLAASCKALVAASSVSCLSFIFKSSRERGFLTHPCQVAFRPHNHHPIVISMCNKAIVEQSFKLSRQKCDQLKRKHFVYKFSIKITGSKHIGQCCRNAWLFMLLCSRLLNGRLWAHCGDHEPVGAQAVQTDEWPLIPIGFSQLKAVVLDRLAAPLISM